METQDLLGLLFDTVEDGFLCVDLDGTILMANRWMEDRYPSGIPLVGKKCYEILRDRRAPCAGCPCQTGQEFDAEAVSVFRSRSNEGRTEWLEARIYPLKAADGRLVGAMQHIKDITEQRRTEEQLNDELQQRRILVRQSRDGIVVMDRDGGVVEANEEYSRMLGYSLEEVYDLHIWDWNIDYPKEELLRLIDEVDASGDHFQTRHRRKDGSLIDVEISSNGALVGGQKLVFCVCRDISEKKAMEERIQELAIRDPLTDAYNRRHIFARIEEMISEYQRTEAEFCVSILDLDHFKRINDTFGHIAGDHVLKHFAQILKSSMRRCDLLGRYGGEEFIIVSRNTGIPETAAMIKRMMDLVRRQFMVFDGRNINLTFSCGIAGSSELVMNELSVEALLHVADDRLYCAKETGRDRFVCPDCVSHPCRN